MTRIMARPRIDPGFNQEETHMSRPRLHGRSANFLAACALLVTLGGSGELAVASGAPGAAAKPPVAAKKPVVDSHFGTPVRDDYRWLENWSDPATRSWVEAQNAATRCALDSLPARRPMLERVAALTRSTAARYSDLECRGGIVFAMKDQPPQNQPMLVVLGSLDDLSSERLLVDPNALDPSGATTIDFYVPSIDGSRMAVSLSKGGTESGDVHLFDVRTRHELPDVLPRVNGGTAGGSIGWTADNAGLWYTRYPAAGERPAEDLEFWQQAWFHRLGTAEVRGHLPDGQGSAQDRRDRVPGLRRRSPAARRR